MNFKRRLYRWIEQWHVPVPDDRGELELKMRVVYGPTDLLSEVNLWSATLSDIVTFLRKYKGKGTVHVLFPNLGGINVWLSPRGWIMVKIHIESRPDRPVFALCNIGFSVPTMSMYERGLDEGFNMMAELIWEPEQANLSIRTWLIEEERKNPPIVIF